LHSEKILSALTILEKLLKDYIIQIQSIVSQGRAKIILKEGILYLQYNIYGEYGYQFVFSEKEKDFARFDNYDTHWNVKSKPNHFHPRGSEIAVESPMTGNPKKDMLILVEIIKTRSIWKVE
jgi:hypothetical protein